MYTKATSGDIQITGWRMIIVKRVSTPSASTVKGGKTGLTESKAEGGSSSGVNSNQVLVAYFSHSGNTRVIANQIHESIGGGIFEIMAVDPYPGDYGDVVEQARKELQAGYKPELKAKVENMGSYDVVFVGYPNWWGTIPRPVASFLSSYDLTGKTVVPFCTHEGSGLGRSVTDIKGLCPQSVIPEGIAVRGRNVKTAKNEVSAWLRKIGLRGE
jgi:hypothetical protein